MKFSNLKLDLRFQINLNGFSNDRSFGHEYIHVKNSMDKIIRDHSGYGDLAFSVESGMIEFICSYVLDFIPLCNVGGRKCTMQSSSKFIRRAVFRMGKNLVWMMK